MRTALSARRYGRRVRPALRVVLPAVLLAATVLSGCTTKAAVNRRPHTGSETASVVDGVQQITVRAGATLRFAPSTITVHPGKVRVVLVNTGGAPHNLSVLGFPAAFVPLASSGETKVATFVAPAPGSYTFVCTIHQKQGQTGTLVVLPD